VLAGALAVAAVTVVLWRRWARRLRAAAPVPQRPAHEIALQRLDELRRQGLHERAEWKPFYFAVTEIIREYLGARYGFDSLEMTTTELLAALQARGLGLADHGLIETWCATCDLVKFAKYLPLPEQAQAALEGAYRIIDATRVRAAAVALPNEVKVNAA